jgi:hypothetical protein
MSAYRRKYNQTVDISFNQIAAIAYEIRDATLIMPFEELK